MSSLKQEFPELPMLVATALQPISQIQHGDSVASVAAVVLNSVRAAFDVILSQDLVYSEAEAPGAGLVTDPVKASIDSGTVDEPATVGVDLGTIEDPKPEEPLPESEPAPEVAAKDPNPPSEEAQESLQP